MNQDSRERERERERGAMVSTRNRATQPQNSTTTKTEHKDEIKNGEDCEYEQSRDQRIKENMQRMQNLGILELSLKLKPKSKRPIRTPTSKKAPLLPSEPSRRSSRLTTLTPICYTEKKDKSAEDDEIHIPEGSNPEIYTEEHEKLLGDYKASWTVGMDGYGENRNRIYDPVNGKSRKTCHQCRENTLGQHTQCCKCNLKQGRLCGDCLYMRYGENVIEASQNPSWICPACRGICNCSRCRKAKGWAPTGLIYRKVLRHGFKSVAHYLIQTRRMQTNQEVAAAEDHVPAKRSMSITDTEAKPLHDVSLNSDKHPDRVLKSKSQVIKVEGIDEAEKEDNMNATCAEEVDSYGGIAYDSANNNHILREIEDKTKEIGIFLDQKLT